MVYWFARLLVMEEETTGQSLFEAARGAQIDLADMARAGLLQRNNCPIEIALGLSASVAGLLKNEALRRSPLSAACCALR